MIQTKNQIFALLLALLISSVSSLRVYCPDHSVDIPPDNNAGRSKINKFMVTVRKAYDDAYGSKLNWRIMNRKASQTQIDDMVLLENQRVRYLTEEVETKEKTQLNSTVSSANHKVELQQKIENEDADHEIDDERRARRLGCAPNCVCCNQHDVYGCDDLQTCIEGCSRLRSRDLSASYEIFQERMENWLIHYGIDAAFRTGSGEICAFIVDSNWN